MTDTQIWIVDDDESIRWVVERALQKAQFSTRSFVDGQNLLAALEHAERDHQLPTVLVTDVRMPGVDGMEVLTEFQRRAPHVPVVVMTAHSDLDSAVNAFQGGAFEYLAKPFDLDEAVQVVQRAQAQHQKTTSDNSASARPRQVAELIGEASAMQEVFRAVGRLSGSSVSVLLTGASGTGKELVARALHQHSPRQEKPFVALNMAAIPAELVESELFGHEKGAFTGANQRRIGRFEQAHGGTLFLDEIGDMPLNVQTRLLRVLAEGQFYPVGSAQAVSVDVRIIAATHQQLEHRVQSGDFREDLFHRLNVIRLRLPALTERKDDIPKLTEHFLQAAAQELGGQPKQLTSAAMRKLSDFDWPGNVRQLENTCRWLTVMAPGVRVDVADLPAELLHQKIHTQHSDDDWLAPLETWLQNCWQQGLSSVLDDAQAQLEKRALELALQKTKGHKQEAAKLLGWGRNTLTRKLTELNVKFR